VVRDGAALSAPAAEPRARGTQRRDTRRRAQQRSRRSCRRVLASARRRCSTLSQRVPPTPRDRTGRARRCARSRALLHAFARSERQADCEAPLPRPVPAEGAVNARAAARSFWQEELRPRPIPARVALTRAGRRARFSQQGLRTAVRASRTSDRTARSRRLAWPRSRRSCRRALASAPQAPLPAPPKRVQRHVGPLALPRLIPTRGSR
jgi:hypothetical protein